ncbi:MAG: 3'-5' exonuclease [Bacteroidota bacterium]|nr:3'-5' exonuclease [Bacteroidota bacterium]
MKKIAPALLALVIPIIASAQNTSNSDDSKGSFLGFLLFILVIYLIVRHHKKKSKQRFQESVKRTNAQKSVEASLKFEGSESQTGKYLILDTETTGLPKSRYAEIDDFDSWPYPVQIAWMLFDEDRKVIKSANYILKQKTTIPTAASHIHKITTEIMKAKGVDPKAVYEELTNDIKNSKVIVAHNIEFDIPIIECDYLRNGFDKQLFYRKKKICTMKSSIEFCKLKRRNGGYKFPKLEELFGKLFYNDPTAQIQGAHDASVDTMVTAKCFFELLDKGIIELEAKEAVK